MDDRPPPPESRPPPRAATALPEATPGAAAGRGRLVLRGTPLVAGLAPALASEAEAFRLVLWAPVALLVGALGYFAADTEPVLPVAWALAALCAAVAVAARHRPVAFAAAVLATAAATGFAASALRSHLVAAPVLARAVTAMVEGRIVAREERDTGERVIVEVTAMTRRRGQREEAVAPAPTRIRVTLRAGPGPALGSTVRFRARLEPPAAPLRPGGYDLARALWFRGIGATGFVLGRMSATAPPDARFGVETVAQWRTALANRIAAVAPGDGGALVAALVAGQRDRISQTAETALYASGLGHVLSISGYHMALVAGAVFALVRGALALIPALALGFPVKKAAAIVALAATAGYLVLAGGEVATLRSFLMTAVVLIGVLIDRPALSMRTLAVAAVLVILSSPEAVVDPGFQMSFAATLALVASYQWTTRLMPRLGEGLLARLAAAGLVQLGSLVLASAVAGLATMPFVAFHFQRANPWGVLSNLAGLPVLSLLVMPAGFLALVLMPFGFDAPLWSLSAAGSDAVIAIARMAEALPAATVHLAAPPASALALVAAGLIGLTLGRTLLRTGGFAILATGLAIGLTAPQPDVIIGRRGETVLVRLAGGRLHLMPGEADRFTADVIRAADGDPTPANRRRTEPLPPGITCDALGCLATLPDGRRVALTRHPSALATDCAAADIVVFPNRPAPVDTCAARLIDRPALEHSGGLALRFSGEAIVATPVRSAGQDRPWAPGRPPAPVTTPREAPFDPTDVPD